MSTVPDPTLYERAAMWLYAREYVSSYLDAIEFYKQLDAYQKDCVQRMARDVIRAATDAEISAIRHTIPASRRPAKRPR